MFTSKDVLFSLKKRPLTYHILSTVGVSTLTNRDMRGHTATNLAIYIH